MEVIHALGLGLPPEEEQGTPCPAEGMKTRQVAKAGHQEPPGSLWRVVSLWVLPQQPSLTCPQETGAGSQQENDSPGRLVS